MTLLSILSAAAGLPADTIRRLIVAAQQVPELADEATKLLAALDQAVSTENVLSLVISIASEGRKLAQGQIDSRDHPSDAA